MSRHTPALRRRPSRSLTERLYDLWYASTPYQWRLGGTRATQLLFTPQDAWPGRSELGQSIVAGALSFDGPPVAGVGPPPEAPHRYAWLRDLRAVGTEAARRRGRELIRDWIAIHGRYDVESWRTEVLAERLINWVGQYDFFCRNADNGFKAAFLRSLTRQARHLMRRAPVSPRGAARIRAAKGLVYSGLCVPGGNARFLKGLALIEAEAASCIYPDGGLYERSPTQQLEVLRDLVDVQALLLQAQHEASAVLQQAIDRTAPIVRFFRMGDGGLGLFNGGCEEEDWQIDLVLNRSGSQAKAPNAAPHAGFHRMVAGRTTVLVDAGKPPPPGYDRFAHAGLLSFEMSSGRSRLIVNCGAGGKDETLDEALRFTAAHSTLVLDDVNSAGVIPGGGIGRRPSDIVASRREADGNLWVDAHHDGYGRRFGLVHRRRLYLDRSGEDLRGEDVLEPVDPARPRRLSPAVEVRIRFHLHPEVEPESLSLWEKGGQMLTVRHPDAGVWALQTRTGVAVEVEESVYLGHRGEVVPSRQIVLATTHPGGDPLTVRWAFRRLG